MRKLKFPIIKNMPRDLEWLSMDDYLKFVTFNLKYLPPPRLSKKQEMALRVKVPFVKK